MKFTATEIPGIILIEPRVFEDARGSFFEQYHHDAFKAQGITEEFVQDNHSHSRKGVVRGLHYQIPPYAQSKLVYVSRGRAFDVVLDIRKNSKTFGKFFSIELTAENKKMLYVPIGFAHGFLALENDTELHYKVSSYYSPAHERGVLWNDPALTIPWPRLEEPLIVSDKDKKNPTLKEIFP